MQVSLTPKVVPTTIQSGRKGNNPSFGLYDRVITPEGPCAFSQATVLIQSLDQTLDVRKNPELVRQYMAVFNNATGRLKDLLAHGVEKMKNIGIQIPS